MTLPVTYRKERQAYSNAYARCSRPTNRSWRRYGGRGIQFNFKSFDEFIADIGPRPSPAHSLDRINNEGHYEVGNVRWATLAEQQVNRRTKNVVAPRPPKEKAERKERVKTPDDGLCRKCGRPRGRFGTRWYCARCARRVRIRRRLEKQS